MMRSTWFSVILAFAYLAVMAFYGDSPTHENREEASSEGLLNVAPADIDGAAIETDEHQFQFLKEGGRWRRTDATVDNELLSKAIERALLLTHRAPPVRVLRPEETAGVEAVAYGFDQPVVRVRLTRRTSEIFNATFGARANDGIVQYMRLQGRGETYLMSGFVGDAWRAIVE